MRSLTLLPIHYLLLLSVLLLPLHAHAVLDAILGEDFPFKITVASNKKLAESAEEVLRTQRKESPEFSELDQRRAAARFDQNVLARWFRSQGYFDAKIEPQFTSEKIVYQVEPGSLYRIKTINLKLPPKIDAPSMDELPVQKGDALKAEAVLDTTSALKNYVLENYCLYDVQVNYDAEINRAKKQAFVTFTVKPSPSVKFGQPRIEGLDSIEKDFLRHYFTFEAGDCFRRRQIELSRLALLQTNLFARIDVDIKPPENDEITVVYDVTERNHRTIKAGIGYDTNTRAGLSLGWEHRNLRERGQRLTVDARFSDVEKIVEGELTVPHFMQNDQTLTLRSDIAREKTDAYEISKGEIGADLQRPLYRHLSGSIGTTLEYSRQEDLSNAQNNEEDQADEVDPINIDRRNFTFLSFPLRLDYVNNNNPLNPTRGWALGVLTEPFFNLENTGDRFVKSTLALSTYFTANDIATTPTLALRVATGTISGASLNEVPVADQFFVGGGGSVRGYAYQSVGRLSEDGLPLGGLAFSETSIELRLRFSQSWGAVAFVDGGYAYPDKSPSFGDEFLWGAGVGIRYFTSFAPIRIDVAKPLDRRRDLRAGSDSRYFDDSVEIYINIGQAF